MMHRLLPIALIALALPALMACGAGQDGRSPSAAPAPAAAAPVSAPAPLDRHALALQLGNGFRAALYRLAVMQQPRDGATDLGQELPSGLLRDVRCTPAGAGAARCRVRWETLRGTAQTTDYAVRALRGGCFAAAATPRLPQHYDPTIATYAEHPLNAITSLRTGC